MEEREKRRLEKGKYIVVNIAEQEEEDESLRVARALQKSFVEGTCVSVCVCVCLCMCVSMYTKKMCMSVCVCVRRSL